MLLKKIKDENVLQVWTCPRCNISIEISPKVYNDIAFPMCKRCDYEMDYTETRIRARVIAFVEGGIVHDVMADAPVSLRIVDYDTEGSDRISYVKLPGNPKGAKERCHISKYELYGVEDLEPFFKQKAIK